MDWMLKTLSECCSLASLLPVSSYVQGIVTSEIFSLNDRRFKVIRQIGEGGYAFVYLVKEQATPQRPMVEATPCAIKKILAATGEKLSEARREIEVLQQLSHPNCLALLDSSVGPGRTDGGACYTVLMLFPAFQDGTLQEELQRLHEAGKRLSNFHVLDIFRQVCEGVAHIHSKGFAHRDIKPHNVLITRPEHNRPEASTSVLEEDAAELGVPPGGTYEAVIMDFGSARPALVEISNRMDALALQEEAEAHSTATYRAPELFDVPTYCSIDAKVDVWSLGCTLYHMLYGASPFQEAVDTGGSLPLAVLNCRIPWPKGSRRCYPEELHQLVTWCLTVDPVQRPAMDQLLQRVKQLLNTYRPAAARASHSD